MVSWLSPPGYKNSSLRKQPRLWGFYLFSVVYTPHPQNELNKMVSLYSILKKPLGKTPGGRTGFQGIPLFHAAI
jgi:hypothetical protein